MGRTENDGKLGTDAVRDLRVCFFDKKQEIGRFKKIVLDSRRFSDELLVQIEYPSDDENGKELQQK